MKIKTFDKRMSENEGKIKKIKELIENPISELPSKPLCYRYKTLGDLYINKYLDEYVKNNTVEKGFSDEAIKAYQKACSQPFTKLDYLYFQMALGNAYKEIYLPKMKNKESFDNYYKSAKQCYQEAIDFHFNNQEAFPHEYFFISLEQVNLEIRKKAWSEKKNPRRVNIYHSLKSPSSHLVLHGIYYYAYLNGFELWEYRYGKVRNLDKEEKFVLDDRLNEAGALIFLLSEEYNSDRKIIEQEIGRVKAIIDEGIDLKIVGIDLGNEYLVDGLKNLGVQIFQPNELEALYKHLSDTKDIYERRKEKSIFEQG